MSLDMPVIILKIVKRQKLAYLDKDFHKEFVLFFHLPFQLQTVYCQYLLIYFKNYWKMKRQEFITDKPIERGGNERIDI